MGAEHREGVHRSGAKAHVNCFPVHIFGLGSKVLRVVYSTTVYTVSCERYDTALCVGYFHTRHHPRTNLGPR